MSPLKLKLHRIHPNLRSVVYCSAMASGDKDEWEFGWSQFKKATVASEASKLMSALACTRKTQLLERSGSLILYKYSKSTSVSSLSGAVRQLTLDVFRVRQVPDCMI